MAAASDKRRKDVAELEHGLEHNGDIHLLPTSTTRSYARPRSLRARRVQCAPITRTGCARLAATTYCPAPLRPQPQSNTSVPPRRATMQRLSGLRGRRTYDITARRPATRHGSHSAAHLHRPTHGPELHRAAAGERRHRCHASSTENDAQDEPALIPIVGTASL
ncbi:hypothetical protein CFC21_041258 [Triticum aestivum]|uniref:Uncharacterized protein n=2 Tax=Triticum aestivum TaxID=4565 RepID=A0A9R1FJB8_WHEAT|nr:hypothetical protein CFC21_041258 [Triticum aestivum]